MLAPGSNGRGEVDESGAAPAERRRIRTAGVLARFRTGPRSFAEFYGAMFPGVLRFLVRHTGDVHLAFDLAAETFAKAYEKRADFRGATDTQATAWLWAIARNELGMYRRARKAELAAMARLGLERPHPSDAEVRQVEEDSAMAQARAKGGAALSSLPIEQREVLEMRFGEELGYRKIALRLGVSEDVVRARSSRGLRALRSDAEAQEAVHALEN